MALYFILTMSTGGVRISENVRWVLITKHCFSHYPLFANTKENIWQGRFNHEQFTEIITANHRFKNVFHEIINAKTERYS